MNKLTVLCAAALIAISTSAIAADMKMDMKSIDANSDGMISKDEFIKHHEMMYDHMKKNKDGLVSLKDMGMMHKDMGMKHKDAGMKHKDMGMMHKEPVTKSAN